MMGRMDTANRVARIRLILFAVWLVSFAVMTICTIVIMAYCGPMSLQHKVLLFLPVQVASGFFFPISIGKIMQLVREKDVATALWNFSSECGEAGLSRFYASREGAAKTDLESKFGQHTRGDILLAGPALRLFLAPGAHFHDVIKRNVERYEKHGVTMRAIYLDAQAGESLGVRSLVEEFNASGLHPMGKPRVALPCEHEPFDWNIKARDTKLNLEEFLRDFLTKYGENASTYECRCVGDLESVARGIRNLNAMTQAGNLIQARTSIVAPYFTAVIFPDVCYYTPNMLNPNEPVNMPMLVFLRGGPVYEKILTHFKIIWWLGRSYDE